MSVALPRPDYDTDAPRHLILDEIRELINYRDLIRHMVKRNVTARYKRSVLGVIWTQLDPLLTMIIMALVFTAVLRRSIPGFPVYLLSGLIIWNYVSQSTTSAISDLLLGGALLGRVYLPQSIFAVTAVLTGFVNILLSIGPLLLLIVIYQRPFTIAWLFVPFGLLIVSAFTLGLGLFVSAFAVFFTDIQNIFNIIMRLLMYLSAIFYTVERLPEALSYLIMINPIYNMIQLFRDPVYNGSFPPIEMMIYSTVIAVSFLSMGLWVFTKLSDKYAYHV